MAKPTRTPGTVYYILHDKQWTRGVYVGRTGDSATEDQGRGFATLIAMGTLQGCRKRRPLRPIIELSDQSIRRASGGGRAEPERRDAGRSEFAREKERRSRRSRRRDDSSDSSEENEPRTGRRAGKLMAFERMSRRFAKMPGTQWEFVEALAEGAGYSSVNRVELYVTECTKLRRSRYTALMGTLLSRIVQWAQFDLLAKQCM